jgi:hypothetical protein
MQLQAATGDQHCPEFHIVAHSEGSVVGFLAILQALQTPVDATNSAPSWVSSLRSFMTIGSPIDKHLLLWPQIWPKPVHRIFETQADNSGQITVKCSGRQLSRPIKWFNYYDYGDPIGFELDSARGYLNDHGCQAFNFTQSQDIGFSRYMVPGHAHNGYWADKELFRHYASHVGLLEKLQGADLDASPVTPLEKLKAPVSVAAPRSHFATQPLSLAIPYAACLCVHLAAVYIMLKAVLGFIDPDTTWRAGTTALTALALSLLLFTVTITGRLPRLVKRGDTRWWLLATAIFIGGTSLSLYLLPYMTTSYLTAPFATLLPQDWNPETRSAVILVGISAIISGAPWLLKGRPGLGRRLMVGLGATFVGIAVIYGATESESFKAGNQVMWPLVLSALAFIYLWWLGIVLFDLAFVWHRYIRNSKALCILRNWCDNPGSSAEGVVSRPDQPSTTAAPLPPAPGQEQS